jgi:hypothetical protein
MGGRRPRLPPKYVPSGPRTDGIWFSRKAAMTNIKKQTRFSPLGQAMIFVVFLLMFIVRWFFFGSVLRSFNYGIILLPLAAIAGGLLIYARYRQRERQRIREANIKVAAIIEQARQEAGLVDETDTWKINEYHLDDESNGLPQRS